MNRPRRLHAAVLATLLLAGALAPAGDPRAADPRLVVERFAASPDIVHPVSLICYRRGVLVIESHTHFRPTNYKGPPHDRVRLLEDTDGDGKADRFTTFFEGTRSTMDLALHPDGSVYLATRNEILRLRDTDDDGKADQKQRLVYLETKGDYPHNGLSGLAFDSKGDLLFGMGENLGAAYKLIGSDGLTIGDEGEGGNVFWCTADGKRLRRVATGFWNPFGICIDIFGRVFAVDNDPDAMPPCRLLHVVEGGDYGYQFRYGRSGRHPFQSWNGQLPGTLPMAAGTGEGPCEVLSYESDGLPEEYLGNLMVTSWADHRVERYVVSEHGASVAAERKPFVQGDRDFRPVGLDVAADGSLFVSDWVLSDYNLHGRGAVWHVRRRDGPGPERSVNAPKDGLRSLHRPVREATARELARENRQTLRSAIRDENPRVRTAALTALIDADDRQIAPTAVAEKDPSAPIRALAVRALAARGDDASRFLDPKYPAAVRLEAITSLREKAARPRLLQLLTDPDPFLRHAAVRQLAQVPGLLADLHPRTLTDAGQRLGLLLARRAGGEEGASQVLTVFLTDPDPEVRFLAAKWVADRKLNGFRTQLVDGLKSSNLPDRLYFAYTSALARLDDQDVSEGRMADFFLTRLTDPKCPPSLRGTALRLVPPTHPKLTLNILSELLRQEDAGLRLETVRTLTQHPDPRRFRPLLELAKNAQYPDRIRAEALAGVAERAQEERDGLFPFLRGGRAVLRDEALRALVHIKMNPAQRQALEEVAREQPDAADLVARVLGKPFTKDRPRPENVDAWLKRLEGPADAEAGRRVFFHPRLANCARCHRVDGRGADVGPDLSAIGRTERRHLLESILQPDNLIAPHYQTWLLTTADGKARPGMLVRTYLDEYTYIDPQGVPFKVLTRDVVESQSVPRSIMPAGLADLLTDQELRDLLAFLGTQK